MEKMRNKIMKHPQKTSGVLRSHRRNIPILLAALLCLLPFETTAQIARQAKNGIIITRRGGHVRAMEPFRGVVTGGGDYAGALNRYQKALGPDVHIYSMLIPTAVEFYCPPECASWSNREKPVIENINRQFSPEITVVDAYSVLKSHVGEEIYARTDHHWLPLGAYYCAEAFAQAAEVPFFDLSHYEQRVVHNFVGTMSKFSGDPSVKQDPEEFIYHVPADSNYVTTYVGHNLGKGRVVTGLTEPFNGPFFLSYKDGSAQAYCTFMGGDTRTTHVHTATENGRRLMIIKDSYGNAVPGYLFQSFEDIYVVDFRYFQKNIVAYAREKGITDLLFVNNLQHAYAPTTTRYFINMLNK